MKLKNWLKKDKELVIKRENGKIYITNNSETDAKLFCTQTFRALKRYININFEGDVIDGTGAILTFLNRKKERICNAGINSKTSTAFKAGGLLLPVIVVKPKTSIVINTIEISLTSEPQYTYNNFLGTGDILVITPLYPSLDNMYACGFVHTRVKSYVENGLKVDVAVINEFAESSYYNFEGIDVYKTNYKYMRDILMAKSYKAIFVHFYDSKYAHCLETSYLNDTPVFLWNHGADILSCDASDMYTPYFSDKYILPHSLKKEYEIRNKFITKYATNKNYNWIFVSNWEKERAEEFHKVKFNNSIVIPNLIDTDLFKLEKKSPETRKKIFMLRRWDNYKKYAVDTAVLSILELSRRDFFEDLEFYVCGEGNVHDSLIEPLKQFKNVHILNRFMSHEDIYNLQKECGIGLFPTRWDTQGVSALEAAASGLAVITTDLPVIREYFEKENNMLCPINDYISIADKVEFLYKNPKEFSRISKNNADYVKKLCSFDQTVKKEIEYYENNKFDAKKIIGKIGEIDKDPILTVTVPSYKAEKFMDKCLISMLKSKYKEKIEILVINDGSTDNTQVIGEYYQKITTNGDRSIVKLINKENGGHGSGINKGIELAKGKYFRVVDADDWVDTEEFDKSIEYLLNCNDDLVLNDYCEARTYEDKPFEKKCYSFMECGITYNFNDICQNNVYGFTEWGPSLPTTAYKTQMLKDTNFKLLEKTFYVDMLYNAYSILLCNTISRVDANIYRYYIGNVGQSVSTAGWKRNYLHHQNVIIELMKMVTSDNRISPIKKDYILNRLLLPMVTTQYYILIELFHSPDKFRKFEKRIKEYPSLLKYDVFNTRRIKIYRASKGILVKIHPLLHKISDKLNHVR